MRKSLLSLFTLSVVLTLFADNYKIIQMNTPSVKIGSREYRKGDVFSDDSIIIWSKEKQAIKAQNLQTKEIHLFTEPDFRTKKINTIKEYYIKKNHLSARATGLSLGDLSEQLNDTFYLLDTIRIESPIPLDSTRNYYIRYSQSNQLFEKTLPTIENYFLIVRSVFNTTDSLSDNELNAELFFRSQQVADDYLLTDSMKIVFLSLDIE